MFEVILEEIIHETKKLFYLYSLVCVHMVYDFRLFQTQPMK